MRDFPAIPYQWQKMNISEPAQRSKRLFNDGNPNPQTNIKTA